jgi:hypothetical protein
MSVSAKDIVVDAAGETVPEHAAKKLVALIESGVPAKEAEAEVGMTLGALRQYGAVNRTVRGLLDRLGHAGLLTNDNQNKLARAVLTEVMLQDEDVGAKIRAAKAILDADKATAATLVQVNNNVNTGVPTDPEIINALTSLGLLRQEEETK